MIKKILLLSLCCVVLIGCSKNEETDYQNSIESKSDNIIENIFESNEDKKVEIIMKMYDFSEDSDIQTYVDEYNQKNGTNYKVYDESHYIMEITEKERLDILTKTYGDEGKKDFLSSLEETYPGVFTNVEFDDNGQTIILYANNDSYKNSLGAGFGAMLMSAMWSDICQSYNMIPLDERDFCFTAIK